MKGHYFAAMPSRPSPNPDIIIFLHGYGGNFLFYLWAMKTEFPEAVILLPSWGIDWTAGLVETRSNYLQDMINHFTQETGMQVIRPWLFGISQGGIAGFEFAAHHAERFRGYVSIASYPGMAVGFPRDFPMLMLNGIQDDRFPIGEVRRSCLDLIESGVRVFMAEIESDHFFLLSNKAEAAALIKEFQKTKARRVSES